MLTALFLNLCVLVSSAYLLSLTFRPGRCEGEKPWYGLRLAALSGIGLLVLHFHATLQPGVNADLRAVPFVFALLRYGPAAAVQVGLPMVLFRFYQGGAGAPTMVLSLAAMLGVGTFLRRGALLKGCSPLDMSGRAVLAAFLTLLPNGVALLLLPNGPALFAQAYLPVLGLSLAGYLGLWSIVTNRLRHLHLLGRLHAQATLDPLTGLANRRQFDLDLAQSAPEDALLMVDIDHFKRVNDAHGHAVGDLVLRAVAETMVTVLREQDRGYRFGGEEFAVLLREVNSQQAHAVAERVRQAVAAQTMGGVAVTLSAGWSLRGQHPVQGWMDQADQALYRAKQRGRNRVCTWEACGEPVLVGQA